MNNPVLKEMVSTEMAYNQKLLILNLVFARVDLTNLPILKDLKSILIPLKTISGQLIQNAMNASLPIDDSPGSDPQKAITTTQRKAFMSERAQLLNQFFDCYESYSQHYNSFIKDLEINSHLYENVESHLSVHGGLSANLIEIVQRGFKYQMLIDAAIKFNDNLDQVNITELKALSTKVAEMLLKTNSKMPVEQAPKEKIPPVSETSEQAEPVEETPQKSKYRFGDFFLRPALASVKAKLRGTNAPEKSATPEKQFLEPTINYSALDGLTDEQFEEALSRVEFK